MPSQASHAFFYIGHGQSPIGVKLTQALTPPPRLQPSAGRVAVLPPLHSRASKPSIPRPSNAAQITDDDLAAEGAAAGLSSAAAAVKRRLHAGVAPSEHHNPAQFMAEITAFVQEQLHLLNKKYPPHLQQAEDIDDESGRANANATRLQQDQYRVAGSSSMTVAEKARKARLEVFTQAQRVFADSFRTYKLFLDALADEHVAYDRFLEDRVIRGKEVIAGLEGEMRRRDALHQDEIAAIRTEHTKQLAALTAERDKLVRQRQQLLDAQKERHRETDAKKQIQDLEHQLRAAQEALVKLQDDCNSLTRQNEILSIGTFSDALDAANQQLAELKAANVKKDDMLIEAHDETAVLTRDLKKIVQYFNSRTDQPLTHQDVRVGDVTLRALFPEEARKLTAF